ncbi:MAG: ABC transporter ATP-binding protein [Alphaproteobacteria bacterium]|nr:ABC transporter ATP-binding protein [Alphaproteobacteria bacterium]
MAILRVESLSKRFGGLAAVDALSFQVEAGDIRGLIGPNGAGKTTTFNVISGFYAPTSGRIVYDGHDIAGLKAHRIAALGVVRTFQASLLFHEMTVLENVLVGRHLHAPVGVWDAVSGRARVTEAAAEARAIAVLETMGLADRRHDATVNLPHGLQRALGIAVALAAEPKLLMLDEPFTGMNLEETRVMMGHIDAVRRSGVTILLVEHDMQAVMGLCDRITVLNFGRLLAEGTPAEIRGNANVIEAYLGTAA